MTKLIKLSIIPLSFLLAFFIMAPTLASIDLSLDAGSDIPAGATLDSASDGLVPTPTGGNKGGCPPGTANCGNYTLNDMVGLALTISQFILGIVGSLALLAFIVGGFMWLLSAGKAEMVEKGKQTILGAVVGLAIVFTSFMIIQLVFTALGIPYTTAGEWAKSNWTSVWRSN